MYGCREIRPSLMTFDLVVTDDAEKDSNRLSRIERSGKSNGRMRSGEDNAWIEPNFNNQQYTIVNESLLKIALT